MKCLNFRLKNLAKLKRYLNEPLVTSTKEPKTNQTIDGYLVSNNPVKSLRFQSPLALAKEVGITKEAPLRFITSVIERQFEIKWATTTGEPDDFNYYKFCDIEKFKGNKTVCLKYQPRNAHTKVQLYRYCRTNAIENYTKEELCPPVYVKTTSEKDGEEWRIWNAFQNSFSKLQTSFNEHFLWIDKPIRDYISRNACRIIGGRENLRKSLNKHTLYWAVVQDKDFQSGDHLKLNDIGETQVYVGKANNGIRGRWIKDANSHCRMMKKCLDNVRTMTTYEPERLKGIQLVQARLLLAKLRRESKDFDEGKQEKHALFLMRTYDGKMAETYLKREEKLHINGKDNEENDIITVEQSLPWKPKNMAYGMNGK